MFKNIYRTSILIRKSPKSLSVFLINSFESERRRQNRQYLILWNNIKLRKFTSFSGTNQLKAMSTSSASGATSKGGAKAMVLPKHTNRLANEKSPYLLQHAHNPVDWYPWGEEAIKRAREEDKLIFLSVGYSTCHWCHVMEHESFENENVARFMNENFINIKVDREERPDIDKIYMQFVLMMNGHGGWPMSVWLTPDLAPITAGTYFPPHDRYGIPSFLTILKTIADNWRSDSSDLRKTGMMVINVIKKTLSEKSSQSTFEPGSVDEKMQQALRIFRKRFDSVDGGFGTKPKFPEVSRLNLLFHAYIITRDEDILNMVLFTLEKIRNGGIHDHVFGGFARYAVDKNWHVPHFEKMLYDQGQLMSAYANAYRLTNDAKFLESADGIFRYIMKDLYHPAGGFFSGEDADSLPTHEDKLKIEGAFYAWTSVEIRQAISGCAALYGSDMTADQIFEIYAYHYNVKENGNVEPKSDPHGHLTGKNILIVKNTFEETCSKFNLNSELFKKIISTTNDALHEIREKRPRPHLDTKIITSWNGLVLSGLNKLANCDSTKRDQYMLAARELVEFAQKYLYDKERRKLRRSCYGYGTNNDELADVISDPIDGFLDDYAFLIKGLLDYYKASLDGSALAWAKELQDIQDELFWDDLYGGYFYCQDNSCNVVRIKEDHDGAEPCGNSISAHNLLLLSHYFDEDAYAARASRLLEYFADTDPFGYNLPEMMSALLLQEDGLDLVAVVGPETELTKKFVEICQKLYIPGMIIVHVDPDNPTSANNQRVQDKFKMIDDKPTVYICHQKVCRMPITDPEKLEETLRERFLSKERLQ